MEFQGESGKPGIPALTLENYLRLEHLDVIPPRILRKIITMHGFYSQKVPKDDLLDAVRSIDLMDAQHSTLESEVSSNAFQSLDDVIKDISVLHWQECCITSIETINSMTFDSFSSGVQVLQESAPDHIKPNCSTVSSSKEIDHEAARSPVLLGLLAVAGPKQK